MTNHEKYKDNDCQGCPEYDNQFCEGTKIARREQRVRRMPFGKHKGKPIVETPIDYLIWLKRQSGYKDLDRGFKICVTSTINAPKRLEKLKKQLRWKRTIENQHLLDL